MGYFSSFFSNILQYSILIIFQSVESTKCATHRTQKNQIWVELLTKQKPTAKSSRLFAHKKMPTGQKPTKHYRHCIKCGLLAVGIWSWANGFGGQMAVGKCSWAFFCGHIFGGQLVLHHIFGVHSFY